MKNINGIIWLETADSTNNEAKRRSDDIDNLSVLSALLQTSGRGQSGNTWSSEYGKNLLFSILLKFDGMAFNACDQFLISESASVAIADFLHAHGIEAAVKWPNDIYVSNRKICGILTENSLRGSLMNRSIVGIGLNVNQTVFDESVPNAISMAMATGRTYDIHELLDSLVSIFREYAYRFIFESRHDRDELRSRYLNLLWRKDEVHRYTDMSEGKTFDGIIRDVDKSGRLLIEDLKDGIIRSYSFKEVGFVL